VIVLPLPTYPLALTQAQVPEVLSRSQRTDDPLSTVGLALLAYGLVQLLSKVIDRVTGRPASTDHRTSFNDEDRKRLERSCDLLVNGDQRLQRIGEAAATQQKLIGQVLDELREYGRKHELLARKVNAVWNRIGSRTDDAH
jgi:hypothetical protein